MISVLWSSLYCFLVVVGTCLLSAAPSSSTYLRSVTWSSRLFFCLHFPLPLLSTRENKSDFGISARFGFVLAGCDRKNEKPEKPKRRKADKPKKTSRKADKPTSRQAAKPQKQSRKVEKSKSQSIINHHIHSFLHSSFIADRIFTTSPIAHRASRIAHHRATP